MKDRRNRKNGNLFRIFYTLYFLNYAYFCNKKKNN